MKTKILVIVAIIVSALMIQGIFAQGSMNHKNKGDRFSMFQKLNLTEEQQDQISTRRINHQMETVDLKAHLEKKKLEMAELKNNGNYTREQYIAKVEAINSAKNQLSISKANFQMDVYQILDDTQKQEWNKFSSFYGGHRDKRVTRKMRAPKID